MGLFIQPACLQHRYIRHANSSHIFERPERLRAVLLGVAAAVARLEEAEAKVAKAINESKVITQAMEAGADRSVSTKGLSTAPSEDLSSLLSSLSINSSASVPFTSPKYIDVVTPPVPPSRPGDVLLHHPALQLAHPPPPEATVTTGRSASSPYLADLLKWASEAAEKIRETGNEIPVGLNQSDLYLGPGSILAIEGAVRSTLALPCCADGNSIRSRLYVRR